MSAAHALQRQFKELAKHPVPGFRVTLKDDNIFVWEVGIIGPPGTAFEGGYFLATMKFPSDFPFNPPTFNFNNKKFFHPNVYPEGDKAGELCVSILHPPSSDETLGERPEEQWNPARNIESVLISIVSLLSDPNCSSPANVDAGVLYRKDRPAYNQRIKDLVTESKKDIPPDLVMPTSEKDFVMKPPPTEDEDDSFLWDDAGDDDYDDDEDMDFDEGSDDDVGVEDDEH
ncbi:Ubiquitin-conjugating enzyme E2 R2 [Rhizophlyctis rosea]|uniref:Ubiquitin-conjugating enzyme E2 R2 n=1 Tax=Rhizophlyctis rosea TaxID=64517 RepID=A0AAD5X5T1_9FUNG|nr:Ubiquitin-conjugating enzyme E2 R2 [Rhizophlyctis rosea]